MTGRCKKTEEINKSHSSSPWNFQVLACSVLFTCGFYDLITIHNSRRIMYQNKLAEYKENGKDLLKLHSPIKDNAFKMTFLATISKENLHKPIGNLYKEVAKEVPISYSTFAATSVGFAGLVDTWYGYMLSSDDLDL